MPTILLMATCDEEGNEYLRNPDTNEYPEGRHSMPLPDLAIKHCSYVKGLLEAAPDSDATIDVPHADAKSIDFLVGFLEQHKDDEEVLEGWEKQKPRELTPWDKAALGEFVGIPLVSLLKASNFLGSQMMLNAVARYVGEILVTKNEKEVQDYFGVHRDFTKDEEEQVKAKYAVPFY
jgi:hypothetical protein